MINTVTGIWRRDSRYNRRFDENLAIWMQTFPPFLLYRLSKNDLIDYLADAIPPFAVYHLLKENQVKGKSMLDLFAGIGGWSIGAFLYFYPDPLYVEAVEIDARKVKVLNMIFKELKKYGDGFEYNILNIDIRKYEPSEKFDIVTGSPPCEDYTPLNAFRNFRLYAGTDELTQEYLRVVNSVRPIYAFYENVYAEPLVDLLKKGGFETKKIDFGQYIPQHRERLIGIRKPNLLSYINEAPGRNPSLI
jgi:site-specific DNA-cytosine methylase